MTLNTVVDPRKTLNMDITGLSTHQYIDFLHGFENMLARTKFVKEWLIHRNNRKEIEISIVVDESYSVEELYRLYRLAEVLGCMAVSVQKFAGARCFVRDVRNKNRVLGFDDIIIN